MNFLVQVVVWCLIFAGIIGLAGYWVEIDHTNAPMCIKVLYLELQLVLQGMGLMLHVLTKQRKSKGRCHGCG